ncbi:hypothetical protein Pla123a_34790 [Posidoniimonas polymericola]|uniref:DUF7691 domain-containing protein n=1 Tax=Posidoniimonas polymericola TaxID=2528002 RepID=A0A5C5YIF6_9BACT|nr:hypothetical protein [Posidoniimonas polymericola]TWT74655.1 hypothetical protein Pla123a_34790 [Posidoniimonas polymericola]
MSYVLTAYVVDIDALSKAVGSGDEQLVTRVIESAPEEFDEDDLDDDELSLAAALRELVMAGTQSAPESEDDAHQYGYALQSLCRCLGDELLPEMWAGVRWEAVEDCGLEELLTESGPPVPLPENDDFPSIGHLKRGEIDKAIAAARKRLTKTVDEDIEDLLDEYIDWLEAGRTAHLDMVFFYA